MATHAREPLLERGPGDGKHGRLKTPMPADFAEVAPTMLVKELRAHYNAGWRLIARWMAETGAVPKKAPPNIPPIESTRHMLTVRRPSGKRVIAFKQNAYLTGKIDRPHRDDSRAGQAADYLRRFGPVVRCDSTGMYSDRGTHWRRGSVVLGPDEVIERAMRNGWNPDAWRQVA